MIAFAFYMLKVFTCSAALFLYYKVALQNKAFHQWNRFYLLIITMLSIIIPFLEFPVLLQSVQDPQGPIKIVRVVASADEYAAQISETSSRAAISAEQWGGLLYGIICTVFVLVFIRSLLKIRKIIRGHTVQLRGDIKFIETDVPGTPFSFFSYIFWNPAIDLQSETGQQILHHEMVHVQQKHTLDKVLMQVVLSFFWCNPVFWLIRKELSMIHEFIADQRSVGTSGASALASMILQSAYPNSFRQLTNQFFTSTIKRRLAMLTKVHNPRFRYFTRILALPVLALVGLAFTLKTKDVDKIPNKSKEPVTAIIDAGHGYRVGNAPEQNNNDAKRGVVVFNGAPIIDTPTKEYNKLINGQTPETDTIPDKKVFVKAEVMPQFPGGEDAWQRYLNRQLNTSVPVTNKAPKGTYKVEAKFIVDRTGTISSIEPLTSYGYGMEEELVRLIKKGPKWSPAIQNGRNVTCYAERAVTFQVE